MKRRGVALFAQGARKSTPPLPLFSRHLWPHPICPLLFVAAHMYPTLVLSLHNTAWLARILAHSLPHTLIVRLSVYDEQGEADMQKQPVNWDGLFVKLVVQIGFMTPISTRVYAEKEPSGTKAITLLQPHSRINRTPKSNVKPPPFHPPPTFVCLCMHNSSSFRLHHPLERGHNM